MKYYIDTEFIEGFHKPFFGKKRHFIDLISIGIVADDGRELYHVCKDFNPDDADEWVHKNVLAPLYDEMVQKDWDWGKYRSGYRGYPRGYTPKRMKKILKERGVSKVEIAELIKNFVNGSPLVDLRCGLWPDDNEVKLHNPNKNGNAQPEFYAYYADYDWVVFCSLFGRMIDLPDGLPMYCRDLKQMIDEVADKKDWYYGRDIFSNTRKEGENDLQKGDYPATLTEKLEKIKKHSLYPKQENEHNALDDAHWNKALYEFLTTVSI